MAKNSLYRILSRIIEIKPGEEVIALSLFLYFFLITAPYNIFKPLRDADYLNRLGYESLPIAYLLTAILIGFVVNFHSKLQVKIPRHLLIMSSLIFFILTCLLFWLFFPMWKWLSLVFWLWANVYLVVAMTQFWITVNDVFNPREAKRMIGFFGSGGILGGIVGALATSFLARTIGSYSLLLIASGLLLACVFIVNYVFLWQKKNQIVTVKEDNKGKRAGKGMPKVGLKDCFDTVRKSDYLVLLAAIVTITWIVSALIDFQFKGIVQANVSRGVSLTVFFGYFNTGLLIFSFFLQLLITCRLIQRFGIRYALLLFPLVLFLGSVGIAVVGGIIFAILIKGSDKSLSYSLNQSVRELLYIPVSPEFKYKAKIFIDMFLNRFGKGLGAVILMVLMNFQVGIKFVSFVSAAFILAWVILNLKVSKEYTNTVKEKLEAKWERADKLVADKIDVDYTKLVFDTIESRNRSSVLYAMHLFDLIKQDKLTPEVQKLISYKSDEMRVSSLGGLFESGEIPIFPELDDSISEEVLEKDIKEIMSLDVYQEVMKGYVEKVLVDRSERAETAKMEVAKAIGLMESQSPLAQKLDDFLQDGSPEVSRYAIESAAKLKNREHVPLLIHKLHSPVTREDASIALEKYGSKVTGTLADYLSDPEEDIALRKEVASILARIDTQDAADFLSLELKEERGDMDDELIDALDRIRSEKSDVQFSVKVVHKKIAKEVQKYCQILVSFYDLKPEAKEEEMKKGLPKDLSIVLMNVFKLLGLIYPRDDIAMAFQNIRTGTKDSVAYAIELLDNTLQMELKNILFPIIEDLSLEERVKRCRSLFRSFRNL